MGDAWRCVALLTGRVKLTKTRACLALRCIWGVTLDCPAEAPAGIARRWWRCSGSVARCARWSIMSTQKRYTTLGQLAVTKGTISKFLFARFRSAREQGCSTGLACRAGLPTGEFRPISAPWFCCDGATVFEHACRLGLEGIVSKRFDSAYRGEPSNRKPIERSCQARDRGRLGLVTGRGQPRGLAHVRDSPKERTCWGYAKR